MIPALIKCRSPYAGMFYCLASIKSVCNVKLSRIRIRMDLHWLGFPDPQPHSHWVKNWTRIFAWKPAWIDSSSRNYGSTDNCRGCILIWRCNVRHAQISGMPYWYSFLSMLLQHLILDVYRWPPRLTSTRKRRSYPTLSPPSVASCLTSRYIFSRFSVTLVTTSINLNCFSV